MFCCLESSTNDDDLAWLVMPLSWLELLGFLTSHFADEYLPLVIQLILISLGQTIPSVCNNNKNLPYN